MLRPARKQFFSVAARIVHTLDTARSFRRHFPDGKSLLIEGSPFLTPSESAVLECHFDDVLHVGANPDVIPFVNHPTNIGHGECKLLELGVDHAIRHGLSRFEPELVFKLGTRYCLDEHFDASVWVRDKYGFRKHYDESVSSDVYTTGLFSIPLREVAHFGEMLRDQSHAAIDRLGMVEKMYYDLIPRSQVHDIETLGLKGRLSYHGGMFQK